MQRSTRVYRSVPDAVGWLLYEATTVYLHEPRMLPAGADEEALIAALNDLSGLGLYISIVIKDGHGHTRRVLGPSGFTAAVHAFSIMVQELRPGHYTPLRHFDQGKAVALFPVAAIA